MRVVTSEQMLWIKQHSSQNFFEIRVCAHNMYLATQKKHSENLGGSRAEAQRGGQGGTIRRAPNHYGGSGSRRGAPKDFGRRRDVPTMSKVLFSPPAHLLPKDLKFEHGGAKFASCPPGRHLTSLRPLWGDGSTKMSPNTPRLSSTSETWMAPHQDGDKSGRRCNHAS